MTSTYREQLLETLRDPNSLTMERLSSLTEATFNYLRMIKNKLHSSDSVERENALQESMEVQQALQDQLKRLSAFSGLDPQNLPMKNPADPYSVELNRKFRELKTGRTSKKRK